MSRLSKEREEIAQNVLKILQGNPNISLNSKDIAKIMGKSEKGRNIEISWALKWLKRNRKIVQFSAGMKGPGSTYAISKSAQPPIAAPITKQELQETDALKYAFNPPKTLPVCTIEIPKATLKVLVKAVMANCQPMDGVLQRATMQCMEKLI